jgi:hypothetical protein
MVPSFSLPPRLHRPTSCSGPGPTATCARFPFRLDAGRDAGAVVRRAQTWVGAFSASCGAASRAGLPFLSARQLSAPMASRMIGMISVCRMAVT